MPEVLSNRIILTPVQPGNQRGAIWSQQTLVRTQWIADVDFRASGPERGGGNLNIWLVRGGPGDVGSSSIYTVGRFDGLALVVDTQGGSGGMIRGFLNDGSMDFSQHHNIDELAFGHCQYSYRNLGRPSQVKMRQTADSFKVEVDGRLCFESDKFSIPAGYQFGITAATPDNPDSFELFKLVVMREDNDDKPNSANGNGQKQDPQIGRPQDRNKYSRGPFRKKAAEEEPLNLDDVEENVDEDPDVFSTSKLQFADLHNRLQTLNHRVSGVNRVATTLSQQEEKRHAELKDLLSEVKTEMRKLEELGELQRRVTDMERELRGVRNDLGRKIQNNERAVKDALSGHHATLSQAVTESVPGHGKLIFVIVGTQLFLVAAYVVYKRRKASMPKKYL